MTATKRRVLAASVSVLALSVAWHGIAAADDIVINTPTGSSVDLNGDDTLTVTETGGIITTGTFDDAVQATGSNNAIVNKGALRISGTATDVIDVIGTSTSVRTVNNSLLNTGTIDILSNAGRGVAVFFSDGFNFDNSGIISSNAGAVTSVIVLDADSFRFNNSGTIQGLGPASAGVVMINTPGLDVVNSGRISTTFDTFSVTNSLNSTFLNSGTLQTSEDGTTVLTVNDSNLFGFKNTGIITSTGNAATGVFINNSSGFDGTNSGTISTRIGLNFTGSANAKFLNSGTLQAVGAGAAALVVGGTDPLVPSGRSDFFTFNNSGIITGAGIATTGVVVNNSSRFVGTNSGTISTSIGLGFVGSSRATFSNSGTLQAVGDRAAGLVVGSSDFFKFHNSGVIKGAGTETAGVLVNNSSDFEGTNSGTISTRLGLGFVGSSRATFSNSGTLQTFGDVAAALVVDNSDSFKFNNSGLVTGADPVTAGVVVNNSSDFEGTNSGTISTSVGLGFIGSPSATFTNSGTIQGNSASIPTVSTSFSDNFSFTNTGTIVAQGGRDPLAAARAHGVSTFFGTNISIVNKGRIRTKGGISDGIYAEEAENAFITNSGLIVAEQPDGSAIRMDGLNGRLDLSAPAYLGGAISFGSVTALNVTTGPSHSVSWWLPPTASISGAGPNISGTVPWFYEPTTGQFVTFDPSGLTGSFNQLGDTASLMGRLGRYGLAQVEQQTLATVSPLGYGDVAKVGQETVENPAAGRFWMNGFGGFTDHDGKASTLDQRVEQLGVAFGYSWHQSDDLRLGVMAGYLNGNISADSPFAKSQDIDSNGVFAGIYGDKRFGAFTLGLGLAGGWQTNDSTRFVNDNLATTGGLTLGESQATASYDSWYITPEASVSTDIGLGDSGAVLTPSARIRYAFQAVDGYTETGSTANAQVDDHTFGVFEGNLELAVSKHFEQTRLTGRAGYLFRSSAGDDSVPVTLLGITNPIGIDDPDSSAAYVGATAEFAIAPQTNFILDGLALYSNDITGLQGMARLARNF